MKLSPRLRALADLVPPSESVADIGTDHAYIPIVLCQEKKIQRAVASDIHKGPVQRAAEHVAAEGLTRQIVVRIGGGLMPVGKGEVDGIIIAGMGGLMIASILEDEKTNDLKWIVLQPMNHEADLRRWLFSHGWRIEREVFAQEENRLYDMFLCRRGSMEAFSLLWAEIGPTRKNLKDPLLERHLQKMIKKRAAVLAGIGEDNEDPRHRAKRKLAVEEREELEDILWRYKQKKSWP